MVELTTSPSSLDRTNLGGIRHRTSALRPGWLGTGFRSTPNLGYSPRPIWGQDE
jgi:hypothetical protein